MKTGLWSVTAITLCSSSVCAQHSRPAPASEPVVVEVGPHHRLWNRDPGDGRSEGSVVEMATGMNFWDGRQWTPSDATFEVTDEAFVAERLQPTVRLEANLKMIGAVSTTTPDGLTIKSTPVGIGLYDAASGKSAIIAAIADCSGALLSSNQVVYDNAFKENGVWADVIYTVNKGSFEQDVVFRGHLNPADFGFPTNTTRLQIFTELYGAPQPDRLVRPIRVEQDQRVRNRMVSPDLVDELLGFGECVIGTVQAALGKAGTAAGQASAPVVKKYTNILGRTFLIESVEYGSISRELRSLPDRGHRSASAQPKPDLKEAKSGPAAIPLPRSSRLANAGANQTSTRMANAGDVKRPGVVIDYLATIGGTLSGTTTFRGDTTYLISDPVYCGSTIIEGGAVIKYPSTPTTWIKVSYGPLTCRTSSYRPAIFTSKDDNTVGDPAPNSSGNPTGFYANPALWLFYLGPGQSISHCRFRYCQEAVRIEDNLGTYSGATISHSQFINCVKGIVLSGTGGVGTATPLTVNNSLIVGVQYPLTVNVEAYDNLLYNCTVDGYLPSGGASQLITANAASSFKFTNSVFANLTTLSSGSPVVSGSSYNGFHNCGFTPFGTPQVSSSGAPFGSQGAGNYYLSAGHSFRNAGTTSGLSSSLLNELKKRTTYPPAALSGPVTSYTIMSPQAQRDTDTLDLGYHYEALDWTVTGVLVDNAMLVLTNGVAISILGDSGFLLKDKAWLISEGGPLNRNHIARFNTVQEQPVVSGSVNNNIGLKPYNTGAFPPSLECRFTDFDGLSAGGTHIDTANGGSRLDSLSLRDCSFSSARVFIAGPNVSSAALNNNLFEWVTAEFRDYLQLNCYNNLFKGSTVSFQRSSGASSWFVKDNSFDGCALTDSIVQLTHGYNAYINTATRLQPNDPNDKVLTSLTYLTGALGRYYQSTASALRNMGSRNADLAGLYYYTTTTDQAREGATPVDIGYHYASTNCGAIDTIWVDDAVPAGASQ